MATLLILIVAVLRLYSCPLPLAMALAGVVVSTETGLQSGTTIGGDLLPVVLQLGALLLVIRHRNTWTLLVGGTLAGLALASKLTGLWALLAIATWLMAQQQFRPAAMFTVVSAATAIVFLSSIEVLTAGGLSQHLMTFSTAGVGTGLAILRSPNQVLYNLLGYAFGTVVLLPLAAVGALLADNWRKPSVIHISLIYAALLLMIVYTDIGSGFNQLLDITVLTALAVGHLAGTEGRLPGVSGGPPVVLAVTVMVVWAASLGLVRTVAFDLRRTAAAARAGESFSRAATRVAAMVKPGEQVLAEDPSIEVALGRRPLVMDPFMLRRLDRAHPQSVDPLIARIVEREFDLVVLLVPLENRTFDYWWTDFHFGPRIANALRASYTFDRSVGRYFLSTIAGADLTQQRVRTMSLETSATATLTREPLLLRRLRQLLTGLPNLDGRIVLGVAVGSYLTCIAVSRLVGAFDLWRALGVPSGPSLFFDARNLTAAWECQRLGYDPLYANPCDPWGRPLMYLRPWLLLGSLGLNQSHTAAIAVILIGSLFLLFGALPGRVPGGTGIVLAFAACSPAVMFAVERANMDIALFSLLAIAALVWRAFPRAAGVVSPVLVLIAATAKLYPAFALPAFLVVPHRVAARTALLALAAFGLYLTLSFEDVRHVAEIATQGQDLSYGARILPAHLYHRVGADRWAGPAALKQLLAGVPLALVAVTVAVRVRRRLAASGDATPAASALLVPMHMGAFIYLGTFTMANNFDYRLVFLLLTIPQLTEWVRMPRHRLSTLAAATLVGVLTLLWVGSLSEWLDLWDEIVSWEVAALLVAVVAATIHPVEAVRWYLLRPSAASSR